MLETLEKLTTNSLGLPPQEFDALLLSLDEAIADCDAGNTFSVDEVRAHLKERFATHTRKAG